MRESRRIVFLVTGVVLVLVIKELINALIKWLMIIPKQIWLGEASKKFTIAFTCSQASLMLVSNHMRTNMMI